jgi:hypothetical protein
MQLCRRRPFYGLRTNPKPKLSSDGVSIFNQLRLISAKIQLATSNEQMKTIVLLSFLFFSAFVRADSPPPIPDKCYLFTSFRGNGEDGLHLAWSADGLKWFALNNDKPALRPEVGKEKLMRDPCLLQGPDGTFHLVWTDSWFSRTIGYANSKDLAQLVKAENDSGHGT